MTHDQLLDNQVEDNDVMDVSAHSSISVPADQQADIPDDSNEEFLTTASASRLLTSLAQFKDRLDACTAAAEAAVHSVDALEARTVSTASTLQTSSVSSLADLSNELAAAIEARVAAGLENRCLTERVNSLNSHCGRLAELKERLLNDSADADKDEEANLKQLEARLAAYTKRLGVDFRTLNNNRYQIVFYLASLTFGLVLKGSQDSTANQLVVESCSLDRFAEESNLSSLLAKLNSSDGTDWQGFLPALRLSVLNFLTDNANF